jgi:hypothetical protein
MRNLFAATVIIVGALLIVQAAATVLQEWKMAQRPQWDGPDFSAAWQVPAPPATKPARGVVTVAREGVH